MPLLIPARQINIMRKIILTRHGEKEQMFNGLQEIILQDPELTSRGILQAKEISNYIRDEKIDIILTSTLLRSQQTGRIIQDSKKVPIISSIALREYISRNHEDTETLEAGSERAMHKLYSMWNIYESILIVGHCGINRTIMLNLLNMDINNIFDFYNYYGETHFLRFDLRKGDKKWLIADSFIPKQRPILLRAPLMDKK